MDVIKKILEIEGYSSVEEIPMTDAITVSAPGFMDLTIEKVGEDRVSVAHYFKQNGDLMADPEVVFDTADGWVPVQYRQDPVIRQVDESGLNIKSFLDTWNSNLRSQGFVDAAEADAE